MKENTIFNIINSLPDTNEICREHYGANGESTYIFVKKPFKMDNLPNITLGAESSKHLILMTKDDIQKYFDQFMKELNPTSENGDIIDYKGKENGPYVYSNRLEDSYRSCSCNYCSYDVYSDENIFYICLECNKNMCNECYNKRRMFGKETYENNYSNIIDEKSRNECLQNHKIKETHIYGKYHNKCVTCNIPIFQNNMEDDDMNDLKIQEKYNKMKENNEIDEAYFFIPHYTNLEENECLYDEHIIKPIVNICKYCYEDDENNAKQIVAENKMRLLTKDTKECYPFFKTGLNSLLYWIPIISEIDKDVWEPRLVFINLNPDDPNYKKIGLKTTDDEGNSCFYMIDKENYSLDDILQELERASNIKSHNKKYSDHYYTTDDEDTKSNLSLDTEDTYYTNGCHCPTRRWNPINMVMSRKFNFYVDYHSYDYQSY